MVSSTIVLALRALLRNALRSALTMLGIVIGVAAVIAIVTLGRGVSSQVTAGVSSLGDRLLFVNPGAQNGLQRGEVVRPLTARDVTAIEREVRGVDAVSPTAGTAVTAVYGNSHWSSTITGVTHEYFSVRNATLVRGAEFSDAHYQSGRLVCIIGKTVREELFGSADPIGATIRIGIAACPIVGELEPKGQSTFGQDQDNVILAPLRAVQSRITGNENVSSIAVSVAPWAANGDVQTGIRDLMRQRRAIGPQDSDDFRVMDLAEISNVLDTVTSALTLFLGAIAAVSLLVGGIGIMNIMLVSVTERTREIGIRLAIGALEREVLAQFLVEAVILTTVGGAIGVALGLAGTYAASLALGFPFVVDPTVVGGAFVFSALIGVAFGFMPARRAARLDPIEALRRE